VTEGIFAVLYVSIMGLTRFYKTTVFLHLYIIIGVHTRGDVSLIRRVQLAAPQQAPTA